MLVAMATRSLPPFFLLASGTCHPFQVYTCIYAIFSQPSHINLQMGQHGLLEWYPTTTLHSITTQTLTWIEMAPVQANCSPCGVCISHLQVHFSSLDDKTLGLLHFAIQSTQVHWTVTCNTQRSVVDKQCKELSKPSKTGRAFNISLPVFKIKFTSAIHGQYL
jgi:hypothetical protein